MAGGLCLEMGDLRGRRLECDCQRRIWKSRYFFVTADPCVPILQTPYGNEKALGPLLYLETWLWGQGPSKFSLLPPTPGCAHKPTRLHRHSASLTQVPRPGLFLNPRHLRTRPPALSPLRAQPRLSPRCSAPCTWARTQAPPTHPPAHTQEAQVPDHPPHKHSDIQGLCPCGAGRGRHTPGAKSERTFGRPALDSGLVVIWGL